MLREINSKTSRDPPWGPRLLSLICPVYLKDQVLLFFVVVFSALLLQTVLLQPIADSGVHPASV